ncbi:fumarylacetoacetate hydrolase family protein [Maribacter sp.]|nr:fumarylacetoacetate hydrolase family protein [Maribacter sp.]
MKIYSTTKGILILAEEKYYLLDSNWDDFINDDGLFEKCKSIATTHQEVQNGPALITDFLLKPIGNQEIWATGVTYFNSKLGRQEEAKEAGGGDFYERVYHAERPELFFKSTADRAVGHLKKVAVRDDSTWDVPEPELTLCITTSGKIVGYTIGNDMSSRSIEGENPLYLPQAKTYDRSAAIGPCIFVTDKPFPITSKIYLEILRKGNIIFEGEIGVDQIVRKFETIVAFLFRHTSYPKGCYLMTGTGIVPDVSFTLIEGDTINITIDNIGILSNTVG